MNRTTLRWILPGVVCLLIAMTAHAGGWATVTVQNLPDYFVAGKPVTLNFVVRQHGVTPLAGLSLSVRATAPGAPPAKGIVKAWPAGDKGEYAAVLTLPQPGDWTIQIDTGWPATSPLLVKAIREGSPAPPPLSEIARGERLFVSKACITCHVNREVAAANLVSVGPELTGRTFPADYLRAFLADPAGTLGKASPPRVGEMPNQALTVQEIASIVAFINRDRTPVVSKAP